MIDLLVGETIDFFHQRSVQVAVLSEYGISEVDRPLHLNRLFRRRNWLALKDELGRETIDCGASRAFAVADHQVAHVYVNDRSLMDEVRALLEAEPGVELVLDRKGQAEWGIAHSRCGDLVAVAAERCWFTYYYWDDDARAPDFARTVDIHRKIGYDPAELILDPKLSFPRGRVAAHLLRKKLGFRSLLEVIPLDASLVRGSHGRRSHDESEWPVLILEEGKLNADPGGAISAEDAHAELLRYIRDS